MKRKTLKERFSEKYIPEPNSGCWLWLAHVRKNGYGEIGAGGKYGGMLFAHRVSWQLENGDIPQGRSVLHKCDTPSCVNPDHLFLGTQKDNMRDMIAKGRRGYTGVKGENNGSSKITEQDVRAIRSEPGSYGVLAKRFNVSKSLIANIKKGRSWTHVV